MEDLTREDIGPSVLGSQLPVVIDVWGPQCQPCLALAPTFEHLARRFVGHGGFFKLEAPKNRMACVDLKVMSLPTFLWFRDGQEVDRLSGDVDSERLTEWVENVFDDERR